MENRKENRRTDLGSERVNTIVSLSPCLQHFTYLSFVQGVLVNAGRTSLAKMTLLFFLMGIVTKETHQVPVQSLPFPVYPG